MKKLTIIIIFVLTLMASITNSTNAATHTFSDVPKSHSNYGDVMYLFNKGIVNPTKKYGINDKMTRESAIVLIAKALKLDGTPRKTSFKDVPKSNPNSGYIQSAVEKGIVSGYSNGTFKPKMELTRGHIAAFLVRAFPLPKGTKTFKDVKPGHTAYAAVGRLVAAGITSGYGDGTFKPSVKLTRAHTTAFVARTLRYLEKNTPQPTKPVELQPEPVEPEPVQPEPQPEPVQPEPQPEPVKEYDINLGHLTEDEKELARLINEYRVSLGLEPYVISKSLTIVARTHVVDSTLYYKKGQTNENGASCNLHSWSNNGSWTPVCYGDSGNNTQYVHSKPSELTEYKSVGFEISYANYKNKVTPKEAFKGWLSSPTHKNLITNEKSFRVLKVMGVAINGNYAHVWFGDQDDPAGTLQ